jgi:hypothetical protein
MQGGFQGWRSSGLPVKGAIDYEASVLDTLNDKVRARVLPSLRSALPIFTEPPCLFRLLSILLPRLVTK